MKKYLLIAVLAVASLVAYAQPRAIGGRLGAFNGVSYEHGIGENNMIEIELGYSIDGRSDFWTTVSGYTSHARMWGSTIQAAATYDWIDPFGAKFPWDYRGEWHWYMGAGLAGGYGWRGYTWIPPTPGYPGYVASGTGNWGFLGAAGRIGVEYDFWFPLQLSIDFRPTLGAAMWDDTMGGVRSGLYWEMTCLALGVRYKF